ncbi:MAG: tRNA (adenosine(37)-N6)-dimethylallyltransferase MiaA [Phycisphaerales bacterium]
MTNRPIVLILGPTAGGKTELSLALAERLPDGGGEVIGADSMQIYRGMDIGTAKPTQAERARAPHHLIDIVEPNEPFTVDDWLRRAERTIDEIRARGRWPIVVGGTNLYIKALLEGLFEGPGPDPELRERLAAQPLAALHEQLVEVDPKAAERIHPNDRKRLIRALEVYEQTGQPISELQRQWSAAGDPRPDSVVVGLDWETEAINRRINARVRAMVEEGLFDEVERLAAANRLGTQAREALGYKQVLDHLAGRCSRDEAVERIKIETRRFARKQRTWLKRFRSHPRAIWFPASSMDEQTIANKSLAFCVKQAAGE